jgi:hypothetical protein
VGARFKGEKEMSLRDQLKVIKDQIKERDREYNQICQEHFDQNRLAKEVENNLVRQIIVDEKLLNLCVWSLHQSTYQSAVHYWLGTDSFSDEVRPLADLAETDYHCSFTLVPEIRDEDTNKVIQAEIALRFDDGEIKIDFDDKHDIYPFITGVTVDTSDLDKRIEETQDVVDRMWDLRKLIK